MTKSRSRSFFKCAILLAACAVISISAIFTGAQFGAGLGSILTLTPLTSAPVVGAVVPADLAVSTASSLLVTAFLFGVAYVLGLMVIGTWRSSMAMTGDLKYVDLKPGPDTGERLTGMRRWPMFGGLSSPELGGRLQS